MSLVSSTSTPGDNHRSRGSGTVPGPCAVEAVRATRPRVQPPQVSPEHMPVQVVPSEAVMDAAAALLGSRMEMHATTKHLEGTRVREGGAAFGRLAELATRKSARVLVKQNQNQLEEANQNQNQPCSTLTSLPRQPFSSRQPCSYSRQWLLTHRAHCGGSPLRPSQQEPRSEARTLRLPNHANHAPEARAAATNTTAVAKEGAAGSEKPPASRMKQAHVMEPKMERLMEQAHPMG